jgi:hypothetical protein
LVSKQLSDLARWTALICFDLEDQRNGTSHPLCKFMLRQVQRLAAALNPVTE